jgi:hypothetical protein
MAEGSLEAELVDDPAVTGPQLSNLLRGFNKPGKRLLLVLDEAQVLADAAHTDLAHSLRAGLDSRKSSSSSMACTRSRMMRSRSGCATKSLTDKAPGEQRLCHLQVLQK